jgi:predicted Zn-dependent protease
MTEADIAAQVLDLVRAAAGAAEAEVTVSRYDSALTRFANSFIHQNVQDVATTVRLRLHLDGRTTAASTTMVRTDELRALVERTLDASRVAPVDAGWPGLAPPAAADGAGNADPATAASSPDERAARVREFIDAAKGLETAGYCRTGFWRVAFANSAGQALTASATEAAMDAVARTGTSDGVARLATPRLADIDGAVLGGQAAAKARASADAVELPPGRYEVVLEPGAVADILQTIAMYGFNGKAYAERRSFVVLDEAQFDPTITLVDDALDPDAVGVPFDAEGTPKRRLGLVVDGVTRHVVHDRRTAGAAGTTSTGHALAGGSSFGPVATNVVLLPTAPGSTGAVGVGDDVPGPAADASSAALVAQVGRGLLVTDNWYTRVLDPRTLVVTGLTRNGVWLIEDGEITKPVANFRFTQSYPQALGPGQVLGIGTNAIGVPSSYPELSMRAPSLRLASWNYTGGASG